jgi:hypothetical protein
MIPKCIHLIWIGPHEPLWPCIDSWRKDFIETSAWCGKADIARYEILCRHGGVYIDADCVWLGRPLDPLVDEALETEFFGAYERYPNLVMCSLFGSTAEHPILRAAIDAIPTRLRELPGEPAWIATGPALLGDAVERAQKLSSRPVATMVPFERLIAQSWHGVTAAAVPELVARHRRESSALSFQLGYSTNHLWESRIDIDQRG